MKKLLIVLLLLLPCMSMAQSVVRVAINESRPYVVFHYDDSGHITRATGLTVDILHYVFGEHIQYIYCESKQRVIELVKHDSADVGANVTLTADRLDSIVDYSQPYLKTYIGVLAKKPVEPTMAESFYIAVQNKAFLVSIGQALLFILIVVCIIGLLIFLLEYRKRKKSFSAAATLSLIGMVFYAGLESEPTTRVSKTILLSVATIFFFAVFPYITAYTTNQLQERKEQREAYTHVRQLKNTNVYTAPHTSNEACLADAEVKYEPKDLDSVVDLICKGEAVYAHDKNILMNYIFENNLKDKLKLTPIEIQKTSRVLIYSRHFRKHRKEYDKTILKMESIGKTEVMAARYGIVP